MRFSMILAVAAFALSVVTPSYAGSATDDLSLCLADNTTGKDRKDLAKWMFVAMSAHPELKSLGNISDADRSQADRTTAAIFTRLLTQSCVEQTKRAYAIDGPDSFKNSFGALGRLAMQELMANPEVGAAIGNFERYLDRGKFGVLDLSKPPAAQH